MNIIEWIVENKYGKNSFAAAHIANGLKLYELKDDAAKKERVKLYRRWRDSKTFNDTAHCYEAAIKGEEPPVELFASETVSEAV